MRCIKIITLLIICVSCNIENNTPGKIKVYYPIDSVLMAQQKLLKEVNPQLKKTARVDQNQDTVTLRLDSAGWAQEMQIFSDITINKPALRDSYLTDTVKTDTGRWIKYSAKEKQKENVEIEFLHLFFDSKDLLREVELFYKETSSLYNAKREMQLQFSDNQRISGYRVNGYQKIVLKDTIQYQINATIEYD